MSVADPDKARAVVEEFLGILYEHRHHFEAAKALRAKGDLQYAGQEDFKHESAHKELLRLQPLIEEIAAEIDPTADPARFKEQLFEGPMLFETDRGRPTTQLRVPLPWGWENAQRASQRLVGILAHAAIRDEIFSPEGPTLVAARLQRWVWNAAVSLWETGHYKEAVNAAASAVEQQTQLKLGRRDLGGTKLYTEAFNTNPGERRLRFGAIDETTEDGKTALDWTSAHQGAMHYGQGCTLGIRNMNAHGTQDLSEQEALEFLAALSVLARWVDIAEVRHQVE